MRSIKSYIALFTILVCSVWTFAQSPQDTASVTVPIDSVLPIIQESMPQVWMNDCHHGHICCQVGCDCCIDSKKYLKAYPKLNKATRKKQKAKGKKK